MIGELVGAGLSTIGSIAGGIAGRKAADKQKEAIKRMEDENNNRYNRLYNEDVTQRADAQRLIRITEDNIRERNKSAAGSQAVVGGTEASVAASKEANNAALSDTVSQIHAEGEARKDAIEGQYRERKSQLEGMKAGLSQQRGANIASATQGVSGVAASIASAFPEKKKEVQ